MKILQVHNFYRTRGGECSVVYAERALLERHGHEVVPYYRDSRNIDDLDLLSKLQMFISIPYNKKVQTDLDALIRDVNPDIAHVHNVFPMLTTAVYRVLRNHGIPIVQTVHNFRFLCPNGQFYTRGHVCEDCQQRGFLSAVKKRCMHDSVLVSSFYAKAISYAWKNNIFPNEITRYIALNQFFAKRLIKAGIPSTRIRVLGNFTTESVVSPSHKKNYVLYLGRLSKEKGILTLLDAWEHLDGSILKIAGSGPMSHDIEELVADRNIKNVQLLGHVTGKEKMELIKDSTCMVVPSEWYENFPMSIVEAMSLGTPVVASNIGGLPEMIKHSETGLVFESGNSIALEMALRSIIDDKVLSYKLGENALKSAQTTFSSSNHYDALIGIYTEAINDQNSL